MQAAVPMDRVLFGDNQFFGVNHMSEEKARAQAMRFQDTQAIIDVLDAAYAEGIRTFMCTTHDRMAEICDHFRANTDRYPDYQFYPCMPYAHKYANAVTEHGMIEALRMFLPQEGALSALLKGGVSLARKDIEWIMQLLIDAEMKMFAGPEARRWSSCRTSSPTSCSGCASTTRSASSHDHVRKRYGAEPGFITMNVPRLLDVLDRARHRQPDRLREHQQDRLSDVRRHRALRGDAAHPALPAGRHVGARLGRDRAARSDRIRLRPAAGRIDRVRRLEPRQHPADQGLD